MKIPLHQYIPSDWPSSQIAQI